MKKLTHRMLFCALGIAFASNVHAQVLFDHDFTAPDFMDGDLAGQQSWATNAAHVQPVVDSTAGTTSWTPSGAFQTRNWFGGQPVPNDGSQIVLTTELSFERTTQTNPGAGQIFHFGFRAGGGGGDFHPNQGVAQTVGYNVFDGGVIKIFNTGDGASLPMEGNIAASTLGLDIDGGDFISDVFRMVSVIDVIDSDMGIFEITSRIEDLAGTELATTQTDAVNDAAIAGANTPGSIQFAFRDAFATDSITLHRLRAEIIGNGPEGDFDNDGDVDGADFLKWQQDFPTSTAADLAAWQTNYGSGAATPSVGAVPEPTALCLLVLAVAGMAGLRKRS